MRIATYHPTTETKRNEPTAQLVARGIPRPANTWITPTLAPEAMPKSRLLRAHGMCGSRCTSSLNEVFWNASSKAKLVDFGCISFTTYRLARAGRQPRRIVLRHAPSYLDAVTANGGRNLLTKLRPFFPPAPQRLPIIRLAGGNRGRLACQDEAWLELARRAQKMW